ncbi:MAG: hypothetical protein CFH06_00850, partial [Alphaproteobacteria bacterium MarineAlpha3_Bin5]
MGKGINSFDVIDVKQAINSVMSDFKLLNDGNWRML